MYEKNLKMSYFKSNLSYLDTYMQRCVQKVRRKTIVEVGI